MAEIGIADARKPLFESADVIITSPPYPGTYDYYQLQQLRRAWFGWGESAGVGEIGSRASFRNQSKVGYKRWVQSTKEWMTACGQRLVRGGKLCVVVGEGVSRGERLKVSDPSRDAALAAGMEFVSMGRVERRDPATGDRKFEIAAVFSKK